MLMEQMASIERFRH